MSKQQRDHPFPDRRAELAAEAGHDASSSGGLWASLAIHLVTTAFSMGLLSSTGVGQAQVGIVIDETFHSQPPIEDAGFGSSLDASGRWVVVGAPGKKGAGDSIEVAGQAEVWARSSSGIWSRLSGGSLAPAPTPSTYSGFGSDVAISSETVVIGAESDDLLGDERGGAFVFERFSVPVDAWFQVARLDPATGPLPQAFGESVDIDGDTIVVGSHGRAYVYERDHGGTDSWGQVTELTSLDATSDFGSQVAIHGDWIVVSDESFEGGSETQSGAVFVFLRDQDGPNQWGVIQRLELPVPATFDFLGRSLALGVDLDFFPAHYIAAGTSASGIGPGPRVGIWRKSAFATSFTFETLLVDPVAFSVGHDIAMSGGGLLTIGLPGLGQPEVSLFRRSSGFWSPWADFAPTDPAAGLVWSVAMSDQLLVAGSPGGDIGAGMNQGWVSYLAEGVFSDGFESGGTTAWSVQTP